VSKADAYLEITLIPSHLVQIDLSFFLQRFFVIPFSFLLAGKQWPKIEPYPSLLPICQ
jgi:hypothetical protein